MKHPDEYLDPNDPPKTSKDVVVLIECSKTPNSRQLAKGYFTENKWFIHGFKGCWKVIGWEFLDDNGKFDNTFQDTTRL